MSSVLETDKVQTLATMVEEAARSTEEGVKRFMEPAQGTLRRATSKRIHIIFGRRGSGKSSLLRKAGADLTVDRRPIAYVNLETFKGHSYPDVLLSVLINTFREFKRWLDTAAINPANKLSFWKRLFGTTPSRPIYNRKECAKLSAAIQTKIEELERQLHAANESNLTVTTGAKHESTDATELAAGFKSSVASGSAKTTAKEFLAATAETTEAYKRHKIDFLHRHIMDYQHVFDDMATLSEGDAYLLLDDLYQINRTDQANVVDYFHRIAKDHKLWLKIGTIRHRTDWYTHGNPPIGVKLGDDADDIDLDITLEKYELAKDFLFRILTSFANEVELPLNSLLTDGARNRLVLASGGVARDFLSVFRRSIDVARERGGGHRGNRIGAEDVNVAAGEYDTAKREEFKRDTSDDHDELDAEFQRVRNFCLDKAEANCFLLDKDAKGTFVRLIHELVDLKLLHLVRSRVTVSGRRGKLYEAYMLDLSQYAGSRKRRGLELIEFWKSGTIDTLRRASLIYEPTQDSRPP